MSIHHSYFYTYKFSLVAHSFPSLALYPHGATEAFVFVVPYTNVYDISEFFQPHIRSGKVLYHIGIMTCDSLHNFVAIHGIECVTNCLNFCTLWEGVCVVRISPHYKSMNESIVPIGHKGRFLLFENRKNKRENNINRAAN